MPIQDNDLFLIETPSGVSKKITASKLKSNLAANTYNNHKLLVNKSNYTSRYVNAQNMQSSVAPTDYMLVERSGVSYKVNGQQIIDYYPSVPSGSAGPITDSTVPGKLTLGSTANLDQFTPGDAITMRDENGAISSYTPVTSTITNVSGNTLSFASPNQDLKFFKPGDPVQGTLTSTTDFIPDGTNLNTSSYNSNPAFIFDGDLQTYFKYWSVPIEESYPNRVTGQFTVTFSPPLINNSGLKLATAWASSADQNVAIEINGVPFTVNNEWGDNPFIGIPLVEVVNAPSTISSITIKSGYSPATLGGIELNGKLLYAGAKVVSTNTSNNSMVVDGGQWSTEAADEYSVAFDKAYVTGDTAKVGPGGWDKAFDGVLDITRDNATTVKVGPKLESILTFETPITSVSKVQFWGYMSNATTGGAPSFAYLIDGNGTEHPSGLPTIIESNPKAGSLGAEIRPVNGIRAIKTTSQGQTGYIGGIYFDGVLAVWVGDNKVTGPAKSGTGNFNGNSGSVVNVTNSNEQWIDNTNRLGKEFFIKVASTRTGLAILRTKAINAAIAVAASAIEKIKDGEFGIVDGNYWFRDEDTFINLGPINLPSK